MPTTLLISDACVLIDMEVAGISGLMFQLDYRFAVPDILFEEELRERHAGLLGLGLESLELVPDSIQRVFELTGRHRAPGRNDLIALSLAIQEACPLLTGDAALRTAAEQEAVEVRGTLWIIGELLETGLLDVAQAEAAYDAMAAAGSRLPWDEARRQLARYRD